MSCRLHIYATSTTLSGVLGAKQLVVVKMQRTLSLPTRSIVASISSTLVMRDSPSMRGSITSGLKLAVMMLLRQVFWSILGHTTYSAAGFYALSARRVSVSDIPVANGNTMQSLMQDKPTILRITFKVIALVSFTMRDEPTALGYSALTSPLRPIP